MYDCTRNYINGQWQESGSLEIRDIINPANGKCVGKIRMGNEDDVNAAVAAARAAFKDYSAWSVAKRLELMENILAGYQARYDEFAAAITAEMGAPVTLSKKAQAAMGMAHIQATMEALKNLGWEERAGNSAVIREAVGVCGLITPWNWPINQVACKVAPALAAGCTMVLKPSEIAPVDATLFAEVLDAAGVPPGVFNLVHGDGPNVGAAMSAHPDIDMMSFTGSTRAGILVAKAAADSVKRVAQELGGKSPNIIMETAPIDEAVSSGVRECFSNTGQSCNAPTRMLVPQQRFEEAVSVARATAERIRVGDPEDPETQMGPVISETQYGKIQALIEAGMEEGARLVTGGLGKPEGLEAGNYVKPTIFADVNNQMTIAREEIFGPVLTMIPYSNLEQAIEIANDTPYGLSAYVYGADKDEAMAVARRLRAGMVHLNGSGVDIAAPFGGYKQSGNGREWGAHGLEDFLETKAIMGA